MEAAESIFEGKFDNVKGDEEEEDVEMGASVPEPKKKVRQAVSFIFVVCFFSSKRRLRC